VYAGSTFVSHVGEKDSLRLGLFGLAPVPGVVVADDAPFAQQIVEMIIIDNIISEIVVADQNAHIFLLKR
jgi:hypothetical protein